MRMHPAITELLQYSDGVIGRRDYPELVTRLDYAVQCGDLVVLLPSVYATPAAARRWRVRARAVTLWDERAVVTDEAAAAMTFWPDLIPEVIAVAGRRSQATRPGYRFSRRGLPEPCVLQLAGARIASPALTALDLVPRYGGDVIDRALRSRMTTLEQMHRAFDLTPNRAGNNDRRLMLLDSRGEPWSAAERLAHRLLRGAGITRWHANVPIVCDGRKYFQDIVMDDCPVVLEIDGKEFHLTEGAFESDRRRGNDLLLAGRHVLHFTWRMLTEEPGWVIDTVGRARARYC